MPSWLPPPVATSEIESDTQAYETCFGTSRSRCKVSREGIEPFGATARFCAACFTDRCAEHDSGRVGKGECGVGSKSLVLILPAPRSPLSSTHGRIRAFNLHVLSVTPLPVGLRERRSRERGAGSKERGVRTVFSSGSSLPAPSALDEI